MQVNTADSDRSAALTFLTDPGQLPVPVQQPPAGAAALPGAGSQLMAGLLGERVPAMPRDAGPPSIAGPMSPAERLEQLARAQLPLDQHPPQVRYHLKLFQALLESCVAPVDTDTTEITDYRSLHILRLPCLLVHGVGALQSDAARLQRKEAHCQTRSLTRGGRKGSRVEHEIEAASASTQTEGAQYLYQFSQRAMLQCLPAVIDALREQGESDLAEFVTDGLTMLQTGRRMRGEHAPFNTAEGVVSVLMARSISGVVVRLSAPPEWTPPPEEGVPGVGEQQQRTGYFNRLQWLSDGLNTLIGFGFNHSLDLSRQWVEDAIASLQGVLEILCDFERKVAGRTPPAGVISQMRQAARDFLSTERRVRHDARIEVLLRGPFERWCSGLNQMIGWLVDAAFDPVEPQTAPPGAAEPGPAGTASGDRSERRERRESRRQRERGQQTLPAPGTAPLPPAGSIASPIRRGQAAVSSVTTATAAFAALQARPSLRTLPLDEAIARLREAARSGPLEAGAALRDFLAGRRMRNLLHAVPARQAAVLLETLAALVDRCGPDGPGLGFFPMRDLLDAAWTTADSGLRRRLADSVLAHFASGPRPGENPATFRAFCLGGGLEKLFQVLPAADPVHALAALQALERRLALQDRDDGDSRRLGLTLLADDLRSAVQQRRLYYMASVGGLSEAERDASAGDMHAWLAGALHAIAPHAADNGVRLLAGRLADLSGLSANVLPRRPDPVSLRQAALKPLTGGQSASCQVDAGRGRVAINAHNLDTPVFEALLHDLAGRTLPSGGRAFTAFELQVGGEHEDDAGAASRKRPAVARWLATLPPSWVAQHQGGGILYLHDGDRPRAGWARWNPAVVGTSS